MGYGVTDELLLSLGELDCGDNRVKLWFLTVLVVRQKGNSKIISLNCNATVFVWLPLGLAKGSICGTDESRCLRQPTNGWMWRWYRVKWNLVH